MKPITIYEYEGTNDRRSGISAILQTPNGPRSIKSFELLKEPNKPYIITIDLIADGDWEEGNWISDMKDFGRKLIFISKFLYHIKRMQLNIPIERTDGPNPTVILAIPEDMVDYKNR